MRRFSIWGIVLGVLTTTSFASAASVTLYFGDVSCSNTYTLKDKKKVQSTEGAPYLWRCELKSKLNATQCTAISLLTKESTNVGLFDHEPSGKSTFLLRARDTETYFLIDLDTQEYRYHSLYLEPKDRILVSKSCYGKLVNEKPFKQYMKMRKTSAPSLIVNEGK